jgi:hypothetical protein
VFHERCARVEDAIELSGFLQGLQGVRTQRVEPRAAYP